PVIKQLYAVSTQKDSRIAAGDSLGAAASLHLALQYPDLFAQVLSLSGAFLDRTQAALAAQEDLSWLNMYMLIGLDETAVQTERGLFDFLEPNRKSRELLAARQTRLLYE